jgi:hypothetical protein
MELRSAAFALALAFVFGEPAVAQELPTDANIVTGIDISDSVSPADARLEIEALALAIRSPEVLGAIARGRHGRIGFAVFAWHHTLRPQVVAWTIIAGEEDARAAARAIEARLTVDIDLEAREDAAYFMGRLTNLSRAIDHARALLAAAPFSAERDVVNIIGNGADNIDEDAGVARDRLVHAGGTDNGVVLGEDGDVLAYYREEVIGGPGAFLMSLRDAAAFADVMRRKFVLDIVLSAPPAAVLAALPAE